MLSPPKNEAERDGNLEKSSLSPFPPLSRENGIKHLATVQWRWKSRLAALSALSCLPWLLGGRVHVRKDQDAGVDHVEQRHFSALSLSNWLWY